MAEAIVSAVMDQLASHILKELERKVSLVVGVRKEKEKLDDHLTQIKAVLEDAENKEIRDKAVKVWLGQLKDVMYDAEDVLDEWNTRILISANSPHVANRVRSYLLSLCACFKHLGVCHAIVIAHRIKDIRERLDEIALRKNQLGLVQSLGHKEPPQFTSSVVDVSEVFGRDHDKQEILSMLQFDDVENPSIYEAKKLRTLVAESSRSVPSALHQLTCLRTLDLSGKNLFSESVFEVLPSEVNRLLHLRYLDLSNNSNLKELPETVRSLVNLQTLKLNWCTSLCKLPEGIGELSNLRHLEVERTNHLKYYPRGGIERLSQLRTLSKFVVSDGSSKGSVIGELGNLNFLKGRLLIEGLNYVKSVNEAKQAELHKKENILELVLDFGYYRYIGDVSSEEEIRRMEGVLENLEPHKESLERLEIYNYVGSTLPTWMRMMSNITYLCLSDCPNLKVEPHYLFPPRLETLELGDDVGVLSKSLMSLTHNNNLKTLSIIWLPHSSLPQGLNQLTSLQQLGFYECDFLDFKPEELKPLTMLRELDIDDCPIITRRERSREEDWSILTHIPTIKIDLKDIEAEN
ncbi:hypothetical protein IFM89_026254 [Coptis chinensis]|uniref:Rx N-terminal domain-containing protein n=1 Tax=Coptis chinensis TaxID=261450 RepID=A0A835M1R7_9MAGN|nr:hypothetical protein IFM89_026254 [Coptis chinensis]